MKKTVSYILILVALTACTALQVHKPEPTATGIPLVNMPNPASAYCLQNGNKLEIRTAADGSQNGLCVFPDGSSCDEWAYFRGTCGLVAQENATPVVTVFAPTKESGGASEGNTPGENNPGSDMPPGAEEKVIGWWGVIKSTGTGAQFDDYFERQDLGQIITFGISSMDPEVQAQIKTLRDSGRIVHLYGTLLSNVPDYNGSQILVDRIEVE